MYSWLLPTSRLNRYSRYGPAPKNSDSAVNILVDVVKDQSGKQYKMDHYATRYPTNVLDVASFLARIAGDKILSLLQSKGTYTLLVS